MNKTVSPKFNHATWFKITKGTHNATGDKELIVGNGTMLAKLGKVSTHTVSRSMPLAPGHDRSQTLTTISPYRSVNAQVVVTVSY